MPLKSKPLKLENGEEEGSSSTPSKDDNEGNDTDDENKIRDAVDQKVEVNTRNMYLLRSRRVCWRGTMRKKQFQ